MYHLPHVCRTLVAKICVCPEWSVLSGIHAYVRDLQLEQQGRLELLIVSHENYLTKTGR